MKGSGKKESNIDLIPLWAVQYQFKGTKRWALYAICADASGTGPKHFAEYLNQHGDADKRYRAVELVAKVK